jgi:hypothetical protein
LTKSRRSQRHQSDDDGEGSTNLAFEYRHHSV